MAEISKTSEVAINALKKIFNKSATRLINLSDLNHGMEYRVQQIPIETESLEWDKVISTFTKYKRILNWTVPNIGVLNGVMAVESESYRVQENMIKELINMTGIGTYKKLPIEKWTCDNIYIFTGRDFNGDPIWLEVDTNDKGLKLIDVVVRS